jgi:hypothetical protein
MNINYKKNRVLLLKELRQLVSENIDNSSIDPFLEQEISEFITEVKDKRKVRKLKIIRHALDEFIKEVIITEEMMESERKYNEEQLRKANEVYAERINSP